MKKSDSERWNDLWNKWKNDAQWNTLKVDDNLSDYLNKNIHGIALEIGCGTGTNSFFISKQCQVDAIDISKFAIQEAKNKFPNINFIEDNFRTYNFEKKYDFIFDRGCFHGTHGGESILERQWFVEKVSNLLTDHGKWLSIIGSTEGRNESNKGPPAYSLEDVKNCVEPMLKIISIQSTLILNKFKEGSPAWCMLASKNEK